MAAISPAAPAPTTTTSASGSFCILYKDLAGA
jgi:hypothetical protein